MRIGKIIKKGLLTENPAFVQVIGMCPVLAVTTSAENGLGMGLATTAVLAFSNTVISFIRKLIPNKVRIPCYIVIIASFSTVVQLLLEAFIPSLNNALGVFIPLIAVNCLILARAESFAAKNSPLPSFFDGIGMGLGFTSALVCISIIREFLGSGNIFGFTLLSEEFPKTIMMILPPGAFFTLGILMAALNYFKDRK